MAVPHNETIFISLSTSIPQDEMCAANPHSEEPKGDEESASFPFQATAQGEADPSSSAELRRDSSG